MPITPALAPANTASVKRRRLSIISRALMMSSRWLRSSRGILLNVSPRLARSPSDLRLGIADRGQSFLRRRDEGLIDVETGALDHLQVAVQHHRGRRAAHGSQR